MAGRVLVTGASGFVGSALCERLLKKKWLVTSVSRTLKTPESVAVGEIGPATDWAFALRQAEVVVHCAARAHIMSDKAADPLAEFRTVNVQGTLHLARQSVVAGVKRFVYLSSIGVNGVQTTAGQVFSEVDVPCPHNAYALSKLEAEQGLRLIASETGLELVIIRPPLVYGYGAPGNFASLLRAVHRGWPLPFGSVHNQRSLVALDNLVDFIILCINHPQATSQTFLVSDGHDLSTADLLRGLARAAGISSRLIPVPVWALHAGADLLGQGDVMQRLCGNLQVDISKARSLLGWTPPVSVEEGFRRAIFNSKNP